MAPKRNDRVEDKPPASPPESEDESSSAEEDDDEVEKEVLPSASSDEDEEEDNDQPIRSQNAPARNPETAVPREESESDDSGSETESDSGTPSPKPIVTKSKEQTPAESRSRLAPPPVKPAAKRVGDAEQSQKSSKKPKKGEEGSAVADDDPKKLYFQRLWSEDDEIAVLNGMLEYHEKKGTDPMVDTSGFHDFIKKALHFDVSKSQLVDKLRRLKKKYVNKQGKGRNGEDPSFTKAHEQKSFELSKMIWSENGVPMDSESTPKANGKARKTPRKAVKQEVFPPSNVKKEVKTEAVKMMEVDEDIDPREVTLCSNADEVDGVEKEILKRSGGLLGAKKEDLDEKWRKLQIMQLELYLERQAFISEHARVLLEHYKSFDK